MHIHFENNSNYIWRIIFTFLIAFGHSGLVVALNYGFYLGVEYFFILAGILLAYSCDRNNGKYSTWEYIGKRLAKLYPHQLYSFIILIIWSYAPLGILVMAKKAILHLNEALPFTFYIYDYNMVKQYPLNFPIWYVSVLFVLSIPIYYLFRYRRNALVSAIAPLFILISYEYIYRHCNSFNSGNELGVFFNETYLRGLADMLGGVMIYSLLLHLKKYKFKPIFFVFCRIMEIVTFSIFFVLIYENGNSKKDIYFVMLLYIGIFFTFIYPDQKTWITGKKLRYLSDLMYPIFLNHIFIINLVVPKLKLFVYVPDYVKIGILFIILTLYSMLTMHIVEKLCVLFKKMIKKLLT